MEKSFSSGIETMAVHHESPPPPDNSTVPIDLDDPHRAALEQNPDRAERPSVQTLLAVVFLALSYVSPIGCGFALVTGIIYPIEADLKDTTGKITWLVGGWSLASAVSFALAGSLSDVFGRRWTIITGQVICAVGSIVAATAQAVTRVIVGSTLLGFGVGIVFVSYAGISELLPNKWRGAGLALTEFAISVPWGVGAVIFSNLLVKNTTLGWRCCYYLGFIFAIISLVGTVIFYFPPVRPQHDEELSRWDELKSIDFVGFFLFTAGLVTLLIGLTWAGQTGHPWKSASVIAPIIVGFCALAACFIYDFTVPERPLFPWKVMREVRDFTLLLGVVFVSGVIFYSFLALLPQGSLYLYTSDPIEIGIINLPSGFVQLLCAVGGPSLVGKLKHIKLQIIVALTIQTVFSAALAGATHNKKTWMAVQAFSVGPFAWIVLLSYVAAGLNVPLRYLGLACGLIGTFRSVGGSIGNAIFNTILGGVTRQELGPKIAAAALEQGFNPQYLELLIPATIESVVGIPYAFAKIPGITPGIEVAAIQAARDVYARGFQMIFYASIPFGVIAIIMACCLRDPSQYLTNHTAIKMEKNVLLDKNTNHEDLKNPVKDESNV